MPEGGIAKLKQGWLTKQGGRVKNWKRRFFVLDGARRLTYYLSEADAQAGVNPLGIIDLQKALFVKPRSQGKASGSTTISWPASVSSDYCFMIITNDRNYGMYSDISTEDCRNWVSALQAVRGNVDSNEIMVEVSGGAGGSATSASSNQDEDQTDLYGGAQFGRSRANTIAALVAYKSLPDKYNIPTDLPPKVVIMYARWHRVLEQTLSSLADHFSTKPFILECNMAELHTQAPKAMRNRLGELVFADYIDELKYNVIKLVGDEAVGKRAFVEATKRRVIQFAFGELAEDEVVRVSPVNGRIQIVVPASQVGKGVHLTGTSFLQEMYVTADEVICGGSVKGLPLAHALNISRAQECYNVALERIGKMLALEHPPTFKCNYGDVHKKAGEMAELQERLGTVIVINMLTEIADAIHSQVPPAKRLSFASNIPSRRLQFELSEDASASESVAVNHNGELVFAAGLNKLHELSVYDRPAHFRLSSLVKACSEESSM